MGHARAFPDKWVAPYSFDDLVGIGHPRFVTPAIECALTVNAREIEIVGYRGAAQPSSGQTLVESAGIGQRLAEQIAVLMRVADLAAPAYKVAQYDRRAKVAGTDDHLTRRIVVTVRPR